MFNFNKYGSRTEERARARKEFFFVVKIILGIVAFLGLAILIARLRPGLEPNPSATTATTTAPEPLTPAQLDTLRQQVAESLAAFRAAAAENAAPAAIIPILESALDTQNRILLNRTSEIASLADTRTLEEITTLLQSYQAADLAQQADAAERAAREFTATEDFAAAIDNLSTAIRLREAIGRQFPRAQENDLPKLRALARQLRDLETRPLVRELQAFTTSMQAAESKDDFPAAAQAARQAARIQAAINTQFRASPAASISKLRELEQKVIDLDASALAAQINAHIAAAEAAVAAKDSAAAIEAAHKADALQQQLTSDFPESRFANPQFNAKVRASIDAALSLELHLQRLQLEAELDRLLRQRNFDALNAVLSNFLRTTERLRTDFPQSPYLSAQLLEKANWLQLNRRNLPTIINFTIEHSAPLPNSQSRLFNTEIPQSLFTQVTGTNPSVHVAPNNPVDSITPEEALHFCRLLSYALARPVRLPSTAEYRQWIGDPLPLMLANASWNIANAPDGTPLPVGTSQRFVGFFDLLGNVSEIATDGDAFFAIGGSVRDAAQRLSGIPTLPRSPNERNRFTGFRVLIEPVPAP